MNLTSTLLSAIAAFIATNIDDIAILMIFYAQAQANPSPSGSGFRHIVLGQYLGFTALVLAALPGFFGGQIVPKAWIGLLGFLPIALGLKQLWHPEEEEEEAEEIQAVVWPKLLERFPWLAGMVGLLNPQIYQVAAVTFANGGDNIGIYVPLFARSNGIELGLTLGVFGVMVGLWCYFAYQLSRHRAIAPLLSRYAHRLVPAILIGLGIYILLENRSYELWPF